MTLVTKRDDQIALAQYLSTLRTAGPALEPRLADAFEKLTPGQLDALIASTLESPDAAAPARRSPEHRVQQQETEPEKAPPRKSRRWFRKWTNDDWARFWLAID